MAGKHKSKGFTIHVDGRPVDYPAGADVPGGLAKDLDLVSRKLVETEPDGEVGVPSGSTKRKK